MSETATQTGTRGSRDFPTLSADFLPMFAYDDDDWRARLDKVRDSTPVFKVEGDDTIWFTKYQAGFDMCTTGSIFWEGTFGGQTNVEGSQGWQLESVHDRDTAVVGEKRHIRLRQLLMTVLSPRVARTWEEKMASLSNELIDRFIDKGEADFVHDFSKIYFPFIGAEIIGAPREDWDQLVSWEHAVFKVPEDRASVILSLANPIMDGIVDYVLRLMDAKRRAPDDTFVGFIVQAEDRGEISAAEARWACTILVLGSGHTVSSHLGYVFRHLEAHPEHRQLIIDDPEQTNSICEELLRVQSFGGHQRTVTCDVDNFHGYALKQGEKVYMLYPAMNRDPEAGFDKLDFTRPLGRHLAFNQGWRQCIGLHFARRARTIAVNEWHKRIPHYRLKEGTRLVEQIYAGVGYHNLPLVWDR